MLILPGAAVAAAAAIIGLPSGEWGHKEPFYPELKRSGAAEATLPAPPIDARRRQLMKMAFMARLPDGTFQKTGGFDIEQRLEALGPGEERSVGIIYRPSLPIGPDGAELPLPEGTQLPPHVGKEFSLTISPGGQVSNITAPSDYTAPIRTLELVTFAFGDPNRFATGKTLRNGDTIETRAAGKFPDQRDASYERIYTATFDGLGELDGKPVAIFKTTERLTFRDYITDRIDNPHYVKTTGFVERVLRSRGELYLDTGTGLVLKGGEDIIIEEHIRQTTLMKRGTEPLHHDFPGSVQTLRVLYTLEYPQ